MPICISQSSSRSSDDAAALCYSAARRLHGGWHSTGLQNAACACVHCCHAEHCQSLRSKSPMSYQIQAQTPLTAVNLQQALTGQMFASGTVSAINAGCSQGQTSLTATAHDLPSNFAFSTVLCSLAPSQSVQYWEGLLQVECHVFAYKVLHLQQY